MSYLGDAELGAGTNVGAGTITANYDGTREAPNDDRRARLPRRRHDAPRAGHGRRRREDGCRRGRHEGRPGRASSPSACRPGSASRSRNPTAGRWSRMTRRSVEILVIILLTLLEGFFVAGEIALVSIRRSRVEQLVDEGRPGARRVRAPARRAGPVPRRLAARPDGHRLLRLGLRRGQPRRRARRRCSSERRGGRGHGGRRSRSIIVTVIARAVHDRLRRARPQDARPRQRRALRDRAVAPDRVPRPGPRPADRGS